MTKQDLKKCHLATTVNNTLASVKCLEPNSRWDYSITTGRFQMQLIRLVLTKWTSSRDRTTVLIHPSFLPTYHSDHLNRKNILCSYKTHRRRFDESKQMHVVMCGEGHKLPKVLEWVKKKQTDRQAGRLTKNGTTCVLLHGRDWCRRSNRRLCSTGSDRVELEPRHDNSWTCPRRKRLSKKKQTIYLKRLPRTKASPWNTLTVRTVYRVQFDFN